MVVACTPVHGARQLLLASVDGSCGARGGLLHGWDASWPHAVMIFAVGWVASHGMACGEVEP